MTVLRRFARWWRPRLPYVNLGLAAAAYFSNEFVVQAFCQPVVWAATVLLGSVGAFLLWPWLASGPVAWRYLALFLQGALVPVCAYCVLFLGPGSLVVGVPFFFLFLPALAWVPVWFAAQAIGRAMNNKLPGGRVAFVLGVVPLLVAQGWAEQQYRAIEAAVAKLPTGEQRQPASLVKIVPHSFVAERLAGALFKYHNFEEVAYDGWRPPLHDPLVNVSLWSRAGRNWRWHGNESIRSDRKANPLLVGTSEIQAVFYHQLFPNLPIKADCTCNHTQDAESYLEWQPWLNSREADAALRTKRKELRKRDNPPGL